MRSTLPASAFPALLIGLLGCAGMSGPGCAAEAPAAVTRGDLDALSEADIRALQDALMWTGDYVGLVSGTLGARTRDAVAAYLKRNGAPPAASLDAAARARLLADAKARRQAVGFAPVNDRRAGVAMALPTKLLPKEIGTDAGTRFSSPDGEFVVDTLSRPAAAGGLPDVFARMSAAVGTRKVTYKLLRPDFFVVAGEVGDRSFYSRFAAGRDESIDLVRGFTISYPKAAATRFDPLTLAVAASFEPFPSAAKQPSPAAAVPVPPPAAMVARPSIADAVLVAPDMALARVSRAACPAPKVDGTPAMFRSEDRKTGLALLALSRRTDPAVPVAATDARQGDALVALFRAAAPDGQGPVTPLQAASVEVTRAPEPGSAVFAVSAPLQGRAAFLFDRSGALAGITETGGRTPPAVAGTIPQAEYRATGAALIAALLRTAGLAPDGAASRPALGFGDVASATRLSVIAVTCEVVSAATP